MAACGDDEGEGAAVGGASTPAAEERTPAAETTGAPTATTPQAREAQSALRTVATGLQAPWGVAILPGGDALVAERDTARILRVPAGGGRARAVMTVPGVEPGGEGGLLGLAVSRSYRSDRWVYAYFTSARDNRIVRFRLGDRRVRPLLTGITKSQIHNGGRLAIGPDGKLYAGVGDAADVGLSQQRSSPNGKILRIDTDGSIPADNPFRGSPVWSLGHRNPQGLAFDRAGRLWAAEFGQNRFDEVNLIRKGRNYGWPEVEGRGTAGGRFESPKVVWPTSEASPSGVAVVGGDLFVAGLGGRRLWRVPLDGASTGTPRASLVGRFGRLRTVVAAPGGRLWVTTSNRDGRGEPRDGDDRIISLRP
jgi:glucose/arabinose dehydrogenase